MKFRHKDRLKRPAKSAVKDIFRRAGLDLRQYRLTPDALRQEILNRHSITAVLDVGAHVGEYGINLRRHGYRGRIVSFEPLSFAYEQLAEVAESDPAWSTFNYAIGDEDTSSTLNVAENSASSSFLPIMKTHQNAVPSSRYVSSSTCEIRRLDSISDTIRDKGDRLFMKVDVQGYESAVLRGASELLSSLFALEIELSLKPLYEGQPLFMELLGELNEVFEVVAFFNEFRDPNSQTLLQTDALLQRHGRN